MTATGLVVELDKVSVIAAPEPEIVDGVMPLTSDLLQVNTGVGVVLLVILYVFDTALHQFAVEVLVITEVGLTVTVTVYVVPAHPLIVGVIR